MSEDDRDRPARVASVHDVERWFIRRGLPHFIHDYSATEDVWTRALPVLVLVFFVEIVTAFDLGWTWWQNLLVSLGGLAIGLAAFVGLNRWRGRRPLQRPDSIGVPELALFVLVPALVYIVTGFRWVEALVEITATLVLIGLIYVIVSYGVVPMTRWGIGRVFRELSSSLGLLVRALPLLLIFNTFLFINAEVWQVGNEMTQAKAWGVAGLFVALGLGFLASRLPRELDHVEALESWPSIIESVASTPAAALVPAGEEDEPDVRKLTRRERGNLALVIIWAHGLQIVLVAALIGLFFVLFGLLVITPAIIESWTAAAPRCAMFLDWTILCYPDQGIVLSEQLMRVAGFLAAFSGLYFTVYVITDQNYRREFFEDLLGEIHVAVEVRAVYRRYLVGGPPENRS